MAYRFAKRMLDEPQNKEHKYHYQKHADDVSHMTLFYHG